MKPLLTASLQMSLTLKIAFNVSHSCWYITGNTLQRSSNPGKRSFTSPKQAIDWCCYILPMMSSRMQRRRKSWHLSRDLRMHWTVASASSTTTSFEHLSCESWRFGRKEGSTLRQRLENGSQACRLHCLLQQMKHHPKKKAAWPQRLSPSIDCL